MDINMDIKFYLWILPVSNLRFVGYGHGYYFPSVGNPWIFKIKLNSYLTQQRTGHNPRPKRSSPIR
jgi:hypothetical protein